MAARRNCYNLAMTPFQPPRVLILTSDKETERRLGAALGPVADIVSISDKRDLDDLEFEVLLTDFSIDDAGPISGKLNAVVLGIGSATEGWADVTLPENSTPREIALACALLGEIARLRKDRDQIAQTHQEVRQLAETDPLTGLPNRRAWDRQLVLEWSTISHVHRWRWLAIVDLDNFKLINDRGGLMEGDRVLNQVAGALAAQLRSADVIARLGGDEFGVLLTEIDDRSAPGVLDRLRAAVADQAEVSGGRLTASIGYAGTSEICAAADLFAAAEGALRHSKRSGGNRASRGEVG